MKKATKKKTIISALSGAEHIKKLTREEVKAVLLNHQGLSEKVTTKDSAAAALKTICKLGYVQIDTINVIERAHHHILWSRLPNYRKRDLTKLQTIDKSIFEYWTHALAYVPTKDFRFFVAHMNKREKSPGRWFANVSKADAKKVLKLVKESGPISIRDVKDDELIEKDHEWASRKPSKRVLQYLFNSGKLVISERQGMLKKYEVTERHFGWETLPEKISDNEYVKYLIERNLRAYGLVSVESIGHLMYANDKKQIKNQLDTMVKNQVLVPVVVKDVPGEFWLSKETSEQDFNIQNPEAVQILSPFDPMVIQRKRFLQFFDHDYRFEAYFPKEKRQYGYFALPILIGDQLVALVDFKTDRQNKKLIIQQWTWLKGNRTSANKKLIDDELNRFEKFQLAGE